MDSLRIILIVLGISLVVGIYLVDRLRRRKQQQPRHWNEIDFDGDVEPNDVESFSTAESDAMPDEWVGKAFTASRHDVLDDEQLEGLKGLGGEDDEGAMDAPAVVGTVATTATPADETKASEPAPAKPAEEIIVLTLQAQNGKKLRGPLLLKALQEAGLVHGEMDVFHYTVEGESLPLFSVANILEPGRFILSEIAQLETPGIALFMRLPAAMPGRDALALMLQKARQMGAQLNATLCDGQRRPLDDKYLARLEQLAARFTSQT